MKILLSFLGDLGAILGQQRFWELGRPLSWYDLDDDAGDCDFNGNDSDDKIERR